MSLPNCMAIRPIVVEINHTGGPADQRCPPEIPTASITKTNLWLELLYYSLYCRFSRNKKCSELLKDLHASGYTCITSFC